MLLEFMFAVSTLTDIGFLLASSSGATMIIVVQG